MLCAVAVCLGPLRAGAQLPVPAFVVHPLDLGAAAGWEVKVKRGTPEYAISRENNKTVIRLKSDNASFGLQRELNVDPEELPYLQWQWKVTELPEGGDFRHTRTDDQAAQVLVAFADRRVLTYIWDSTAPKGTIQSASSIPFVHLYAIVCESGKAQMNRWLTETRSLVEDYRQAYGGRPPAVKGIRLQINSQHTGTSAESYFGGIHFRSHP